MYDFTWMYRNYLLSCVYLYCAAFAKLYVTILIFNMFCFKYLFYNICLYANNVLINLTCDRFRDSVCRHPLNGVFKTKHCSAPVDRHHTGYCRIGYSRCVWFHWRRFFRAYHPGYNHWLVGFYRLSNSSLLTRQYFLLS